MHYRGAKYDDEPYTQPRPCLHPNGTTTTDEFKYGYDRDGNALYRDNLVC
jgi:hypothetical protein